MYVKKKVASVILLCASVHVSLKEEDSSEENSHCTHADHTATQDSKINIYIKKETCMC